VRIHVEEEHAFVKYLADVLQRRIGQQMKPKRKKHLSNFYRPQTNSNSQSNASQEMKFKKPSAI
jgi:hypothetical protein